MVPAHEKSHLRKKWNSRILKSVIYMSYSFLLTLKGVIVNTHQSSGSPLQTLHNRSNPLSSLLLQMPVISVMAVAMCIIVTL